MYERNVKPNAILYSNDYDMHVYCARYDDRTKIIGRQKERKRDRESLGVAHPYVCNYVLINYQLYTIKYLFCGLKLKKNKN